MRIKKRFLIPGLILLAALAGPRPSFPDFDGKLPELKMTLSEVDDYVKNKDADIPDLKPDNESRIFWADSIRKTEYAFVYLHGWSASWKEGEEIERALSERYGFNLYAPLLAGHGRADSSSFKNLTPKKLIDSAKEALAIGKLLGEKVILLSCSTGSTLSNYIAAENPDDVYAQLMFSPNIDIYDSNSELLTAPWGKQLTHLILGDYKILHPPPGAAQYWTTAYSTDGLICLKSLIEKTQTSFFWNKINQPLFMAYYFKDEDHQDHVVSVDAMNDFYNEISTPENRKRKVAFAEGNHCLISAFHVKNLNPMKEAAFSFMEEVLMANE